MKYLIDIESYNSALEYTKQSIDYTHLHEGFNTDKENISYKL